MSVCLTLKKKLFSPETENIVEPRAKRDQSGENNLD